MYGEIFDFLRPEKGLFSKLFQCSMCLGFHVGWLIFLVFWNTDIYLFPTFGPGALLFSFVSSGTTYVLDRLISDDGIQIKRNP